MHTISFLLSADAASQRMIARKPQFVVHVETSGDIAKAQRFVELDADDAEMAANIANAWVYSMGNASAAIRWVMHNGELHKPCRIVS